MKKVKIDNLENHFKQMPQDYAKQTDYYFDSYSHFGIHEEMLKDEVRTLAYKDAIMKNQHLFKDKIVLDLGCGTGILSMFCAQAGAAHVYAIECASIAEQAQQIFEINGFQNKITIIRGKVEEIKLPVDKVDIIVSEWMGYFLLYESMFDSVLYAKDKWLAKNGHLFPDKAQIYVAALEDTDYKNQKVYYWDDVWGFNMSQIGKLSILAPIIDPIDQQNVISSKCCIMDINLETVTKDQLDFTSKYKSINKKYVMDWWPGLTVGLLMELNMFYQVQVLLRNILTGNKQSFIQVCINNQDHDIQVQEGDELEGSIAVKKNQVNPRDLDIKISVYQKNKQILSQFYKLS